LKRESLGRLLIERTDELLVRWLALVRDERLGRHGLSEAALKDSLPAQLRAIGEAILVGASSPEGLSFAAAEHGETALPPNRLWSADAPIDTEQRVLQDVPIEEVVDEYAFAVDVVRNWLVERDTEVPPEEFSFFHSAIFGFVAESVRRYTKFKEERVAREKALFVASFAHQMRTPLSALALKTELLQRHQAFADSTDFEMIRRNIRRLKVLVEGVMRLERSKVSEIPVRPVLIDVERSVMEMVDDLREEAEQKGLRITVDVEPALRAELDPDLLTDALGNFVDNAIRHTAHGTVRVAVERVSDRLVFCVTDTGPGLPEDQRNAPFTPKQSTGRGAGLGLLIAYRAVEALGGVVSVESTPGKGTSISFSVPQVPPVHRAADTASQPPF